MIVNVLWLGTEFSLMEILCCRLLQLNGCVVQLWCYEKINYVPENVIIRDAREIMPESSVFRFNGIPLPFIDGGGIGSLSHFSDAFFMKLLHEQGGWIAQLDISLMLPLTELDKQEYVFLQHQKTNIGPYLMKCPKGSTMCLNAYNDIMEACEPARMSTMHWDYTMHLLKEAAIKHVPNYQKYFVQRDRFWDLGCSGKNSPFYCNYQIPDDLLLIHWSNQTYKKFKNTPHNGSIYHRLLLATKVISADDYPIV